MDGICGRIYNRSYKRATKNVRRTTYVISTELESNFSLTQWKLGTRHNKLAQHRDST